MSLGCQCCQRVNKIYALKALLLSLIVLLLLVKLLLENKQFKLLLNNKFVISYIY